MADQAKFQKMLEILLVLDCRYGRTIQEIAERFGISERTVYRYMDTFKQVGFVIENNSGFFKINKEESTSQDISQLLHFTEEEAFILSKAIHAIEDGSEQKEKLVKKLYSLYDFDRVIYAITKKEETENIFNLIQAIKQQRQVVLKAYKSGHGKDIRDRVVEPIDFTVNYLGVWCYDTEDRCNKIFKTSRIREVVVLDEDWQYKPDHQKGITDIFRMQSFEPGPIQLKLSMLACNLLQEEFPLSEKYIKPLGKNSYLLTTDVGNFLGVGRFILGLPDEVEVIFPQALKDYLNEKVKSHNF